MRFSVIAYNHCTHEWRHTHDSASTKVHQKDSWGCVTAQMQYLFIFSHLSPTNRLMHAQVLTGPS